MKKIKNGYQKVLLALTMLVSAMIPLAVSADTSPIPSPTPGSISSLLTGAGETATWSFGWFGSILLLFTTHPILIATFAMLVLSIIVGWAMKVKHS